MLIATAETRTQLPRFQGGKTGMGATLEPLIRRNQSIATILDGFAEIGLPDCWLVAGCLAQTVWNLRAGRPPATGIRDYDLIYFDPAALSAEAEAQHERRLRERFAVPLDVKNQARVHLWYERKFGIPLAPYRSVAEAVATFPTTATAVAVRCQAGRLHVCAPFGLDDLLAGIVRPNRRPVTKAVYLAKAARWRAMWPALRIIDWDQGLDSSPSFGPSPYPLPQGEGTAYESVSPCGRGSA